MFPRLSALPRTLGAARSLTLALALVTPAFASPLDDAIALYQQKKFPDARAAFAAIVAAEPANAAATYYLGQTIIRRGEAKAFDEAVPLLEKASSLEPKNARYLVDYGLALMQLANRNTSLSAATKGRDTLEKSLTLAPDHLEARETLFHFYQRAPWPIGSSSKAAAHLEELRQRDPHRALVLAVDTKVRAKEFPAAFKLLDAALAQNPANYTALFHYGRTAAISDLHVPLALTHLQKCLTLTPPASHSPSHSYVWLRIGNLQEKLSQPAAARTAYETALQLDSSNKAAADALAKMK